MKIITWNVNGLRSVLQKGFVDFVLKESPDILCLQETKCHPDQLEDSARQIEGYQSFWSAAQRPGYSGTAIFTRQKPERVEHGIQIPKFDAEGRLVIVRYPKFSLYNCYFPNGGMGPERHAFKQEFLKRFATHLHKRVKAGESVIVVGDYNVAYLDIDVYDPKKLKGESGFLPEEREWMRNFLSGGFVDTFRHFHPQASHRYSWWSMFEKARIGNRGWRIDHICTSQNLESQLQRADILDQQEGSDHAPVVLEVDL